MEPIEQGPPRFQTVSYQWVSRVPLGLWVGGPYGGIGRHEVA
jgi:hypothetical protein